MEFIFKTQTTMKDYNNSNWWIDSNLIKEIRIKADNLKDALSQYREITQKNYGVEISNRAMKTKEPMYVDSKDGKPIQTGYVITASTDFLDNNNKLVSKYIDLWVEILQVSIPYFNAKTILKASI